MNWFKDSPLKATYSQAAACRRIVNPRIQKLTVGRTIRKIVVVPGKLVNIVV